MSIGSPLASYLRTSFCAEFVAGKGSQSQDIPLHVTQNPTLAGGTKVPVNRPVSLCVEMDFGELMATEVADQTCLLSSHEQQTPFPHKNSLVLFPKLYIKKKILPSFSSISSPEFSILVEVE